MKYSIWIVRALIICLMAIPGVIMGGTPGIANSEHDFSATGWSMGELCITCHTPHKANTSVSGQLWNHEGTTQIFTPYTSPTLDAVVGQPDGSSKLCLSCHDATVAIDSYGGATGSNFVWGDLIIAQDLNSEHPISFAFDSALAGVDGKLHNPSVTPSGMASGGTIDEDMLENGKLQCTSCHDIHNTFGNDDLLIKDNTGSSLCLTCHNF